MPPKTFPALRRLKNLTALLFALPALAAQADPRTNSWLTVSSGKYARIYTSDANKTNGITATTWSNGSQVQSLPAYTGVQEIYSSATYVYILTTGLGAHTMGPWYNDATRTTAFVNLPVNQKAFARFPRTPTVPGTKTATQGDLGYFVDGVRMFDASDATSYSNASGRDGDPPGTPGGLTGDGLWNRDAYINEATTFDPALAHQQNTGVYHYHANPIATRYLLGDHVDRNSTTKLFTESAGAVVRHSPIVGWIKDGFPLYGPYGYSSPSNTASGVRRMVSGFIPRDGASGTSNLAVSGRTTLPAWAARAYNRSATLTAGQYGPAVSASFPLGRYLEDNDYLGDLGKTQDFDFDLDEYNGRWCVTPEFPEGTYAYFVAITTNGLSAFPYNVGRRYYGAPTGGTVASVAETVTTNFVGGPSLRESLNAPARSGSTVVLTWSAVEGGTYRVESSTNLATWTTNATGIAAVLNTGSQTNSSPESLKFFRVNRTALANYDPASGTSSGGGGNEGIATVAPTNGAHNTAVVLTITLNSGYTPPPPPVNVSPTGVTLTRTGATTITATSSSRDSTTGVVTANFSLPNAATPGAYTVNCTFGPNTWSLTNGFTVN